MGIFSIDKGACAIVHYCYYINERAKMVATELSISRELYDLIMQTSSFDHAADADGLTRTQDLTRWGWCKVHNASFRPHGACDRVRLVRVGVCPSCDYAMDMVKMRLSLAHRHCNRGRARPKAKF
jgi:hypothetical protein